LNLYRVLDTKAEAYNKPIVFETDGVAIRAAAEAVNDTENPISRNPEDYILFHVGSFENFPADIVPCEPRSVCSFIDLVERDHSSTAKLTGVA